MTDMITFCVALVQAGSGASATTASIAEGVVGSGQSKRFAVANPDAFVDRVSDLTSQAAETMQSSGIQGLLVSLRRRDVQTAAGAVLHAHTHAYIKSDMPPK
jgi:hypothetical protein